MPLRFSFRALLTTITLLMLGMGAMVSPWPTAADAAALLGQLLLCTALLCAFILPRESKPFWIGFALFGFWYWSVLTPADTGGNVYANGKMWRSRLLTFSGEFSTVGGQLPTTTALDWLQTMLHRRLTVGSSVSAQYSNGGYYPGVISDVDSGMYLIRWTDGSSSPAQWTAPAQIAQNGGNYNFRLAGHTILCGLVGMLGGGLAIWIASWRRKESPPGGAADAPVSFNR